MSAEFAPLPTREPSSRYDPPVFDGFEHALATVWEPQDTEPGAVHIKYSPGKKRPPENGFEWIERANNLYRLSDMGMKPVLQKLGIYATLGGIENAQYSSRLDLHFPGSAYFCAAAFRVESAAREKNPRGMTVGFEPFKGAFFTAEDNVRAAARGVRLIATEKTLAQHDILDHSVAYIALPPGLITKLHFVAKKSLRQGNDTPSVEELSEIIDTALNIHTLVAVLQGDRQRIKQWDNLFRFRSSDHASYWIEQTRQHIQSLSEQ
ncbi:MAG TPA: hypothetical protein VF733_05965 [Candidatus Saccharimonadales bacterium]